MEKKPLLEIKELKTLFKIQDQEVYGVKGVDLHVDEGDILAIVGESGSGKSVTMKSLMGILPDNAKASAEVLRFEDKDLLSMSEKERRVMRGSDLAMIFQDPMTALNPVRKIGGHLIEVIRRHQKVSKAQAKEIAIEALKKVGITSPEERMNQYPHEFSGGMRQRVMIAMALCAQPKLLIADEPTTALDVTIQAQILDLLKKLRDEEGMSIILITHDLGVVASLSNRICVMYGGLIMETGLTDEIFYKPAHPYTKALLKAIPREGGGAKERLTAIPGAAPSLMDPPSGCPFNERCSYACDKCRQLRPEMKVYSETQSAACIFSRDELMAMDGSGASSEQDMSVKENADMTDNTDREVAAHE